ncbi:MAG: Imm1 family immunity protein [Gemmataceae bacterium]
MEASETRRGWVLTDYHDPSDIMRSSDVVPIMSEEQLRKVLESLAKLDARVAVLQSPNGSHMSIAIGGPFAGVDFCGSPTVEMPLMGRPQQACTDKEAYFSMEGETIRLPADALMPVSTAIRVLTHFFRAAELPDWIDWVRWHEGGAPWYLDS